MKKLTIEELKTLPVGERIDIILLDPMSKPNYKCCSCVKSNESTNDYFSGYNAKELCRVEYSKYNKTWYSCSVF